jgi:hypothetical protein
VGVGGRLAEAASVAAAEGVDAVVLLGDLADDGDAASTAFVLEQLAGAGLAVWAVAGNHDAGEVVGDRLARMLDPGGPPLHRLADERGAPVGDVRVAGVAITREAAAGAFVAQRALPLELWGDDVTLLLSHFPILSREDWVRGHGLAYAGDLGNGAALSQPLLARGAPTIVLNGHLLVRDAHLLGSVLQLSFASLIEYPNEAALLELAIEGLQVTVDRRSVPLGGAGEVTADPCLAPPSQRWTFDGAGWADA